MPELEAGHALDLLVLQHAGVVVEPQVVDRRPPGDEGRLRPPAVAHVGGRLPQVPAGQEAGLGPELRIDAAVGGPVAQVPPLAREVGLERRSPEKAVLRAAGLRADAHEAEAVRAPQPEARVDAAHAVVVVPELARRHDGAHVRLGVEVVARPPDEGLGGGPEARVRGVVEPPRRLVVRDDDAERRPADLAGQLAAEARVDDGPRVQQGQRRGGLEDLLAFEEERALLGVEEREALVGLDLRLVRLDLREVGVVGHVRGQVRRDAVLDAHPQVAERIVVVERPARRVERAEPRAGQLGQDLQVAALRQVGEPLQDPELRQLPRHPARDRRPRLRLGLAADHAGDLEAPAPPALARQRGIAQALERDRHLGRPAVLDHPPARLVERVPRTVAADAELSGVAQPAAAAARAPAPAAAARARLLRRPAARRAPAAVGVDQLVALDAVAVHAELVRALLIEKRIEQHRHAVVAADLVPVGPVGPDHPRIGVVDVEREVQVVAVVRHPDLGLFRPGGALHRCDLDEVVDVGRRLPDRVVEPAVEVGRLCGAADGDAFAGYRRRREPAAAPTPRIGHAVRSPLRGGAVTVRARADPVAVAGGGVLERTVEIEEAGHAGSAGGGIPGPDAAGSERAGARAAPRRVFE